MTMDGARARWQWKAMPYAAYTRCAACGSVERYCYGKTWERMVCWPCFEADQANARLRRAGKRGKRTGYRHQTRRPRVESIALARQLRARGVVVEVIADRLEVTVGTVRQYLRPSAPHLEGADPRKKGSQTRSGTSENATEKNTGPVLSTGQ